MSAGPGTTLALPHMFENVWNGFLFFLIYFSVTRSDVRHGEAVELQHADDGVVQVLPAVQREQQRRHDGGRTLPHS